MIFTFDEKPLIYSIIFLLLLFIPAVVKAADPATIPVSYDGRFMPTGAYAKKWLYEIYHSTKIKRADLEKFHTSNPNALNFLWQLHFHGYENWDESPLFWIHSAKIKQLMQVPLKQERFSYAALHDAIAKINPAEASAVNGLQELMTTVSHFSSLQGTSLPDEGVFAATFEKLQKLGTAPKQIALQLEQRYPIRSRLQLSGSLLKLLPGKFVPGEWYSLHALEIKIYNPTTGNLELAGNFTLYDNALFVRLRQTYTMLSEAVEKNQFVEVERLTEELTRLLQEGYRTIASKPYLQAAGKQLSYPSETQLTLETLYGSFPFILVCIGGYAFALLSLTLAYLLSNHALTIVGSLTLTAVFLLHGSLLALRSYILGRPPVSNMFETLLYVPWISVLTGLLLWLKYRQTMLMTAGAATSVALLALLQITQIDASFSNVQAVLDSQYWLIIHVLLIVGSYGIFILGGVLGHLYLGGVIWQGSEMPGLAFLAQLILQTMYIGVALLVPGTLLGGVWAAESWGRFWDWDPKEAWAFISICVYLIWIHAYRFNKIGHLGLAIGSVAGLLVISFTWYGVNYILGTGLHSYGFGNGGEGYYYCYLAVEVLLLILAWYSMKTVAMASHDKLE